MDSARDIEAGIKTVTLVYFAWVRERVGRAREDIAIPSGIVTVADLVAHLKLRGAEYDAAFAQPDVVRVAIDQVHGHMKSVIGPAREIAFFPPVTGG